MNTEDFDYDAFLGGLESVDTFSNHTTSPTTLISENDSDSGIAYTPPLLPEMDSTVIDLDNLNIFPLDMENPSLDDPNGDFKRFSAWLNAGSPAIPIDNSTYEDLFSDISMPQNPEPPPQQILSPSLPILSPPQSTNITPITNCFKIQSFTNSASTGTKLIKCEPNNSNPTITIIKTSKPLTLANVPVITMPLVTNDSISKQVNTIASPVAKRRRSDSPTNQQQVSELSTLSLNQLKLQYGPISDEAWKKHVRMIKNRESASLSRKRRKELMEHLSDQNKELQNENDELKRERSKLLTRIDTLEMENELLKKYKVGHDAPFLQKRKPLILMGIVLLVVFNVFTLKSLAPVSNDQSNLIDFYNNQGAIVPSRTILSDRRSKNQDSYTTASDYDYGPNGNDNMRTYPYIQCVAYINKTHSQRINQDLRSWVQDHSEKQQDTEPMIIPDPNSLTISSNPVITTTADSSVVPLHHISRKVARQTKIQSESKGQLQPYKSFEANYDDFIHTLDRKNDTLYFVSFKRDHLILPATMQNQTQRPKMSLILPASMANLNKSIHVPTNHVPMIKIDCEVEDTKLVFVKRTHIPSAYQNDLFQYYSSAAPPSTI
ncbi:unnamed protein product [Adineta steineri]|uniref:BZIP domain-containing protein n=2 Tax=Adineta steineri TaxID=433720 RepID=A0A818MIM6_9BILA|nr:unnamed protein product [Adineta steineri]CAF3589869.1 unnamed protein product [Adineta steineri]